MANNRRIQLLILVAVLLMALRILDGMGQDDNEFLWDSAHDWAIDDPKAERTIELLAKMPQLTFSQTQGSMDQDKPGRNPFIYGIDRRAEREQQQRLDDLKQRMDAQEPFIVETIVEEPTRPVFNGKVLGMMKNETSGQRRIAVMFQDELFILTTGDRLGADYEIVDLNDQRVQIKNNAFEDIIDIYFDNESPNGGTP